MYFEQFYLGCLAHASYLLASEGEAVVVDPQRDVEAYLRTAQEHGVKIHHIFESHLHADFVSGHAELAARTGAKIYLSPKAGAKFPHVAVSDGFELRVGRMRIRVLETPGHTPESICFLSRGPYSPEILCLSAMSDDRTFQRPTLRRNWPDCSTTACIKSC
jgi:hydroxyacylglutathione hydrolase